MRVNVGVDESEEKRGKRKLPSASESGSAGGAMIGPAPPPTLAKTEKAGGALHSKLQLQCADGRVFNVSNEEAMMSSTLWVLMKDVSGKSPKNGVKQHTIPVFDVPSESVELALFYCRCLYKQQVDRLDSALHDWEERFLELDSKTLCDLAKVASNLDIQPLVDLTCRSIAQIMSATEAADELRHKFGLEDPPANVECSCELRSDIAGFDFGMFNSLDHDLSTEEYELVEFDQPSVDELVSFINGSGDNPNLTPQQQQQQAIAAAAEASSRSGNRQSDNLSDQGEVNAGSTSASQKKKRKKRKKKKSPPASQQAIDQASEAVTSAVQDELKLNVSEDNKKVTVASTGAADSDKVQDLQEKVRLASQNLSAVFPESQFEDDGDEEQELIKAFELTLESAHEDAKERKRKPRLDFAPRDVFRSSLVGSSQFPPVHRLSTTMT